MFEFKGLALGARERIAGSVYGTIVVLTVLAGEADAFGHNLWKLEAIVLASVLILWIAHTYAHGLGESLSLGRRLTRNELAAVISRELAIPLASVLPLVAITIGALGPLKTPPLSGLQSGLASRRSPSKACVSPGSSA